MRILFYSLSSSYLFQTRAAKIHARFYQTGVLPMIDELRTAAENDLSQFATLLRNSRRADEGISWNDLVDEVAQLCTQADSVWLLPLRNCDEGEFRWPVEGFYAELLPLLAFDAEVIIELVAEIVSFRGSGKTWAFLAGFEKWCSADNERLDRVVEMIREDRVPKALLAPALRSMMANAGPEHFDEVLMMFREEADEDASIAAGVLCNVKNLEDDQAGQILDAAIDRLPVIDPKHAPRVFEDALALAMRGDTGTETELIEIASAISPTIFAEAAARCVFLAGSCPSPETVETVYGLIEKSAPLTSSTIEMIDSGIARWIADDQGFVPFSDALLHFVKEANLTFSQLDSTAHAILRLDAARLDVVIGGLLASDTYEGAQAANDLALASLSRQLEPEIDFSRYSLSDEAALRIGRRVAGIFAISPVTATASLLALLRTGPKGAADEIVQLMFDPVLLSYWEEPKKYLARRREHETPDLSARIDGLIASIKEYEANIKAVPPIDELFPSEKRRFLRSLKRHAENKEINERAQKGSVLASLVSTRIILNGDAAVFSVNDGEGGEHRSEQEMRSIEHLQALPRLDAIDPFGYWYSRRLLLSGLKP